MRYLSVVMALVLAFGSLDAEARRMGGGKSFGKQSSNVTQRQAAPAAPTQSATAPAASAAPAAAAPRRPWGAMLGGLAAGLGLAWLAQSLGLGEGFGQFLLLALLALVALSLYSMFMRSRRPAQNRGAYAFQGADSVGTLDSYLPKNVGNDASARPFERHHQLGGQERGSGGSGVEIGSALSAPGWRVPEGFDAAGFVAAAKNNFILLQSAWDRADFTTLRAMMTDGMLDEIRAQLDEREQQAQGATNRTEVQVLDAQLLGIEELDSDYMASVEFSGMIREEPLSGPNPFREVWNMVKPKDGSRGWLVAGVQALQ